MLVSELGLTPLGTCDLTLLNLRKIYVRPGSFPKIPVLNVLVYLKSYRRDRRFISELTSPDLISFLLVLTYFCVNRSVLSPLLTDLIRSLLYSVLGKWFLFERVFILFDLNLWVPFLFILQWSVKYQTCHLFNGDISVLCLYTSQNP